MHLILSPKTSSPPQPICEGVLPTETENKVPDG
mgnify:CR=1 FL=1